MAGRHEARLSWEACLLKHDTTSLPLLHSLAAAALPRRRHTTHSRTSTSPSRLATPLCPSPSLPRGHRHHPHSFIPTLPPPSLPHPSTVALVQRRRPSFGGLCSHSFSVTTLIVVSLSPISPCIHSLCCSSTFHLTRAPRPSPATSRQCIWSISTPSILRTRSLHHHHHHGSPPASHPRPRLPW